MRNKWIYDKVKHLVRTYQTRNPDELIKTLNIQLKILPPTQSLLGMYKIILRNRFIFLAENVGELRNTVLAHELGHDLLHRKECTEGIPFHENRIFNPVNRFETEANIFAAHLLIPDEEVLSMIAYTESDKELAHKLGVDLNLLKLKISEMAKMQQLKIEPSQIEKPSSTFLKNYKPVKDYQNN